MALYGKKPVVIEATQWFKNGDHPKDACELVHPDPKSTTQFTPFMSEGKIVRRFNHPEVSRDKLCKHCVKPMMVHGWIDTFEGGHIVCPADFIITGVKGELYPCKPDIFDATYEKVQSPESQEEKDFKAALVQKMGE